MVPDCINYNILVTNKLLNHREIKNDPWSPFVPFMKKIFFIYFENAKKKKKKRKNAKFLSEI